MSTKLSNYVTMFNSYTVRIKEIQEQEEIESLSINEQIEIEIELSTGGPSDGFKIYVDKQTREVLTGCYYYSDWGWYQEKWLPSQEINLVVDYFGII